MQCINYLVAITNASSNLRTDYPRLNVSIQGRLIYMDLDSISLLY